MSQLYSLIDWRFTCSKILKACLPADTSLFMQVACSPHLQLPQR